MKLGWFMNKNEPLSTEAIAYMDKLFPCTKPCDSYGICDGCAERVCFEAGYNFGYRAAKSLAMPGEPKQGCVHGELVCPECTEEALTEAKKKLGW